MTSFSDSHVDLAIDLLVARAALDSDLRAELLAEPEACCCANGIELPPGARIAFTTADSDLIVRHIPTSADQATSLSYSPTRELETASAHFNSGVEETNTNTDTSTNAVTHVDAVVQEVVGEQVGVGVEVGVGAVAVAVAVVT